MVPGKSLALEEIRSEVNKGFDEALSVTVCLAHLFSLLVSNGLEPSRQMDHVCALTITAISP